VLNLQLSYIGVLIVNISFGYETVEMQKRIFVFNMVGANAQRLRVGITFAIIVILLGHETCKTGSFRAFL